MNQLPRRLQSIDVLRAITMFLMIFVNDVHSVKNIPAWIGHVGAQDDGLGFADIVFPAFLFIVGLSLPFAIRNRISKGDAVLNIILYIATRSLALLVMGFFHVNAENYNPEAILPQSIWMILVTIGFFLVWLDYQTGMAKTKKTLFVITGIALLIAMAILYKGGNAESPTGMKPHWWGILGIIGWAYLVCSLVFLFAKGKMSILMPVLVVFVLINIAAHTGFLHISVPVIGDASSVTLVMGGIVMSCVYGELSGKNNTRLLWWVFILTGIGLLAAGIIIRPFAGGISKIQSTPAWVFICAGISTLVFVVLIWLVDLKGKKRWFNVIHPAGTSTLTCYLVPYLLYSVYAIIHFQYPAFLNQGTGGIIRSVLVSLLVIMLVGLMEKRRLRLKI